MLSSSPLRWASSPPVWWSRIWGSENFSSSPQVIGSETCMSRCPNLHLSDSEAQAHSTPVLALYNCTQHRKALRGMFLGLRQSWTRALSSSLTVLWPWENVWSFLGFSCLICKIDGSQQASSVFMKLRHGDVTDSCLNGFAVAHKSKLSGVKVSDT